MTQSKKVSKPSVIDAKLSSDECEAIDKIIVLAHDLTGVQLSKRHQSMIASRLHKRLSELQIDSLSDYVSYFHANRDAESSKLITLVTTHHTYFFREFAHFEFLLNSALPALLPAIKARGDNTLRVWSAACSRGQEAYSVAMYLDLHLRRFDPSIRFEILGTDIDPECVAIAKNGVYHRNELKEVPMPLLGDHWVRGTGEVEEYAKAKKSLRDRCRFVPANLLKLKSGSAPEEKFDLIFCRNVFIYFNPDQIRSIAHDLLSRLTPDGFFFVGISESLSNLGLPVGSPGPSVYRHKAQHEASLLKSKPASISKAPVLKVQTVNRQRELDQNTSKTIRVLCVDDSPTILTLLKQILSKEQGFEVIGIAKNGIEASKQVVELKPDAMTLDIHMPEQTGIEYLEKNFKRGHVPVVMVTSVSRENADLAGRALALGASDYVEKPALTNIAERGEEIRNKIRCAILSQASSISSNLSLDKSFQKLSRIDRPENKLRIVLMSLSSRHKLKHLFAGLTGTQPPTILFIEGSKDALPVIADALSKESGQKIISPNEPTSDFKPGEVVLLDFVSSAPQIIKNSTMNKKVSVLVYGEVSKLCAETILLCHGAHLVLEDLGSGKGSKALSDVASEIVLHTSFAYLSTEFLSNDTQAISYTEKKRKVGA